LYYNIYVLMLKKPRISAFITFIAGDGIKGEGDSGRGRKEALCKTCQRLLPE